MVFLSLQKFFVTFKETNRQLDKYRTKNILLPKLMIFFLLNQNHCSILTFTPIDVRRKQFQSLEDLVSHSFIFVPFFFFKSKFYFICSILLLMVQLLSAAFL